LIERAARHPETYYRTFEIAKPGRTDRRRIETPREPLKQIQRRIHRRLLTTVPLPPEMCGACPGKSILTNAAPHCRQPVVVTMDLRDCFPSTKYQQALAVYKGTFNCSPPIASLLTRLTTLRGSVPQGAPTSSTLVNLCLVPLCLELRSIAAHHEVALTMYLDDITLSGPQATETVAPAIEAVMRHGYAISSRKLQVLPASARQRVTGVVVNKTPSAGQRRLLEVRREILDVSQAPFVAARRLDSLRGKLAQITSINPTQGAALERLWTKHVGAADSHGHEGDSLPHRADEQ
jgi:RNA-directed DNA polymerase